MGIKERKKREREMRRQQIMVAAKRVFSEKGYEKSTMEDIAREAELRASLESFTWSPEAAHTLLE